MLLQINLNEPTEQQYVAFEAYVLYQVNPERLQRGLQPVDVRQAREYLSLAWDFANRFAKARVQP